MAKASATSEADRLDAEEKAMTELPDDVSSQLIDTELDRVEATTTSLVEKLVEGLSPLIESGIQVLTEDRERKDALRRVELENKHQAMKRHTWLLGGMSVVVGGLALTALLLREIGFAEIVLRSGLAVAAGAGLTAMTARNKD